MARIPRLYKVEAIYRNGEVKTRHYQTPEAAEERRARFTAGRSQAESEEARAARLASGAELDTDRPAVTVTASHPVTYPRPSGDRAKLVGPDALVPRNTWEDFALGLGVAPGRVLRIDVDADGLAIEYQPDISAKAAPLVWRVGIE